MAGDPIRHRQRSVSAARAADGDRQVRLALGDVGGQHEVEQREQALVELRGDLARLDVLDYPGITPGEGAQVLAVMRVWQEADVENQVGLARRPVLEAEGDDRERQPAGRALWPKQLGHDAAPEHRSGQVARVHDDVRVLAQRAQQLALGPDALEHAAVRRQWMAAPRLLEAVEKGLLVGLEEEHGGREAGFRQLLENLNQLLEVLAAADVRDDRRAPHSAALVAKKLAERAD